MLGANRFCPAHAMAFFKHYEVTFEQCFLYPRMVSDRGRFLFLTNNPRPTIKSQDFIWSRSDVRRYLIFFKLICQRRSLYWTTQSSDK
jgi:hypothetical protein